MPFETHNQWSLKLSPFLHWFSEQFSSLLWESPVNQHIVRPRETLGSEPIQISCPDYQLKDLQNRNNFKSVTNKGICRKIILKISGKTGILKVQAVLIIFLRLRPWTLSAELQRTIQALEMKCGRITLGISNVESIKKWRGRRLHQTRKRPMESLYRHGQEEEFEMVLSRHRK